MGWPHLQLPAQHLVAKHPTATEDAAWIHGRLNMVPAGTCVRLACLQGLSCAVHVACVGAQATGGASGKDAACGAAGGPNTQTVGGHVFMHLFEITQWRLWIIWARACCSSSHL